DDGQKLRYLLVAGVLLFASLNVVIVFSVAISSGNYSLIAGVNKAEVKESEKLQLQETLTVMAKVWLWMSIIVALIIAILVYLGLYKSL
ncbi:hypothetical protein, partial [Klebsiella pneumoniae]|uniref:hypothetical protein n=1 Tax=Klebsiella pneumoniae TaxID=573 RepID=UPI00273222C4